MTVDGYCVCGPGVLCAFHAQLAGASASVERSASPDPNAAPFAPGDWLRFYRDGRMVVGVVGYVKRQEAYPHRWRAFTDHGAVEPWEVLERRPVTS